MQVIYFDVEPGGVDVGDEPGPPIQCWTHERIKYRITKEDNLDLFDPMFDRFPEPCLRHPVSIL